MIIIAETAAGLCHNGYSMGTADLCQLQLMHFRYPMLEVLNSKMELFIIYLLMTIIIFTTVTAGEIIIVI